MKVLLSNTGIVSQNLAVDTHSSLFLHRVGDELKKNQGILKGEVSLYH